jgi:hypothetical protein
LRVVSLSLQDKKRFVDLCRELPGKQTATLILMEGCTNLLPALAKELQTSIGRTISFVEDLTKTKLLDDHLYLADSSSFSTTSVSQFRDFSVLIFGNLSQRTAEKFLKLPKSQILLEDVGSGGGYSWLAPKATDRVPSTSFVYMTTEYFSRSNSK